MSSQAVGCMTVVLPESKIPEFEAYFDEENEFAFKNTEIWLREVVDARIVGFQRRIYDISCGLSLESCLIEPEDNDIRDVCYNLKLLHLDIDALNAEEHFSENIVFENGTCRYDVKDLYGEDCSYEVKGKYEAEM